MTSAINSYPRIYAIGHPALADLFSDTVIAEEKIDGSQFSMCIDAISGELQCRSKGKQLVLDAPEKLFKLAVETAKTLAPNLAPGWIYRCEYLAKPKHNTLAYDRVPKHSLIVFDVETSPQNFLRYADKAKECERIGLECVPLLYHGTIRSLSDMLVLLETTSCLGGQKIEGFVVKNYSRWGRDGKVLIGKYVSEKFKEVHGADWKSRHPGQKDFAAQLVDAYRTNARWQKALLHLREAGRLEDTPRDIGALMKEAQQDIESECKEEIMQRLWAHFWPQIKRGVVRGLPEWYKRELAGKAFDTDEGPA